MNFKISDKVVCVDDSKKAEWASHDMPLKKGIVYVVESFTGPHTDGQNGLVLVGIPVDCLTGYRPAGYDTRRLRLLSDVQAENRERAIFDKMKRAFDSVNPASGFYGTPINPEIRPNLGDWIKGDTP